MTTHSILWRGVYWSGHEASRLLSLDGHWYLTGSAVFSHQEQPCLLNYRVEAARAWA